MGVHVRSEAQGKDLVHLYLDSIGKYPLLSKEDECQLSKAIQAGRERRRLWRRLCRGYPRA